MKTTLTLACMATLLAACTSTTTTLKHPKTGKEVTCEGESVGVPFGSMISIDVDKKSDADCIDTYLNQGYERSSSMGSIF